MLGSTKGTFVNALCSCTGFDVTADTKKNLRPLKLKRRKIRRCCSLSKPPQSLGLAFFKGHTAYTAGLQETSCPGSKPKLFPKLQQIRATSRGFFACASVVLGVKTSGATVRITRAATPPDVPCAHGSCGFAAAHAACA